MGQARRWFNSQSKKKRVLLLTSIFLLITVPLTGAWYWQRLNDTKGRLIPGDVEWPDNDDDGILDINEAFDENIINIALFGFDRNEARDETHDSYRPDTLMVAAVNLETGQVDVINIPRDTLVPIYDRGGGRDKINASYYYGWSTAITGLTDPQERHESGLNSVRQTVSMALNVPIHYWVSLDMDGVSEIIDILGGVWYDVETNVYTGHGNLVVEAGYQRLSGRQFLWYVRNRDFALGDIQRNKNQQQIMVAAFEQFSRANKLLKAPEVYMNMRNNVETNLTVEQMASLALFATHNIRPDNINTHIMPGSLGMGRMSENVSFSSWYYLIDQQARVELIKDIWGISVDPRPTDTLYPPLPDEEPDDESEHDPPPKADEGQGVDPSDEQDEVDEGTGDDSGGEQDSDDNDDPGAGDQEEDPQDQEESGNEDESESEDETNTENSEDD